MVIKVMLWSWRGRTLCRCRGRNLFLYFVRVLTPSLDDTERFHLEEVH